MGERVITVGSLFSGVGGIEYGLERTGGFRTVWFVEKDPYCQAVLRKHWSSSPIYGDIKQLDWNSVERPDMLTGGFPCQPVSVAGKRKGTKDSRWLWPEYTRAVRILRPDYVLVENVPNLVRLGFEEVLGDLAACGYDAEWNCIRASDVGAPHRRERIFIIGYNADAIRLTRKDEKKSTLQERENPDTNRISDVAYSDTSRLRRTDITDEVNRPTIQTDRQARDELGQSGPSLADSQNTRTVRRVGVTRNAPNSDSERRDFTRGSGANRSSKNVSNPDSSGCIGEDIHIRPGEQVKTKTGTTGFSKALSDTDNTTTSRQRINGWQIFANSESTRLILSRGADWWTIESDVSRVANGISNRVDRLRALGNAVVPQVAEAIGYMILEALTP